MRKKGRHRGALFRFPWSGGSRQRPLDLFALEDLDDIARADVVVVLERHAAFLARLDFLAPRP
jgi:hypothetical protein